MPRALEESMESEVSSELSLDAGGEAENRVWEQAGSNSGVALGQVTVAQMPPVSVQGFIWGKQSFS